jgi:large subunit ribosomal protein LP0
MSEIIPLLKEKVALVFSNEPVAELKPTIEANRIAAGAKAGMISDIDFTMQPGPTGMDPSQIGFFHALSISTKIVKGQIEITKDYSVCKVGKKIGNSEVTLLQKMN